MSEVQKKTNTIPKILIINLIEKIFKWHILQTLVNMFRGNFAFKSTNTYTHTLTHTHNQVTCLDKMRKFCENKSFYILLMFWCSFGIVNCFCYFCSNFIRIFVSNSHGWKATVTINMRIDINSSASNEYLTKEKVFKP